MLLNNPVSNLLLGLAAYKRPGLLGQVQQQQNLRAEQARQAPILAQQQQLRDLQLQQAQQQLAQQQQQQQARQGLMGYLGADPTMAVSQTYGKTPSEIMQGAIPLLAQIAPEQALGMLAPKPGFTLSPGQIRYDAQNRPIAMGGVDTSLAAKQSKEQFDQEKSLRDTFNKETQPFVDVNNAFGRIKASAENPSAAGDMAMIFNYMKMLDPGSTVREGEFATAQNAAGWPERVKAMYNSAVDGKILADNQRADFFDRAKRLYLQAANLYDQRAKNYKGLAIDYNLDPNRVVRGRKLFEDIELTPTPPGTVKRVIR